MGKQNLHGYQGRSYTTKQLQHLALVKYHNNLTTRLINRRIKYGWKVERAIKTPPASHCHYKLAFYYHGKQQPVINILYDLQSQLNQHHYLLTNSLMLTLAINLNLIKKSRNLTYRQLADAGEVTESHIRKILKNKVNPSLATTYLLATNLGYTIDNLLSPSLILKLNLTDTDLKSNN